MLNVMKDYDIRQSLRAHLAECHRYEEALIIEELGLSEDARADMVVVNGEFSCFEIKSQSDTLARLGRQQCAYDKFFDKVTLVASSKHLDKARQSVPEWWGIIEAVQRGGCVRLCVQRPPTQNPDVSGSDVARLLWRDEAAAELESRGWLVGLKSKPRDTLCQKLASLVTLEVLKSIVRERLKSRLNWRSDSPQMSNDGLSRLVAKSCHSPVRRTTQLHSRQCTDLPN